MKVSFSKSLVSVAAAALLVTGFTGCDDTSTTGSGYVKTQATGTVTGTVMDTNGNPLSGVSVGLAGQTVTTDASGIYVFKKVPVVNAAGADANQGAQALQVTINAPQGYLGATVTVFPQAQFDDAESSNPGSDNAAENGWETFVDGFLAQAGTAVLPKLGATVTGRLELQQTEASVANTEITLDFRHVNGPLPVGSNVAQPQNGVQSSYATPNFTTTTDAEGHFSFTGVPSDSVLAYVVGNYTVVGEEVVQGTNQGVAVDRVTVSTGKETSVVNVGDVQVNPVVNEDNVPPSVLSITGQIPLNDVCVAAQNPQIPGQRKMLEDDVRTEIVVNFTEPIVPLSENDEDFTKSVTVYSYTQKGYVDQTAVISGNQLIITLTTPLVDGEAIDVNLQRTDFKDAAGNFLVNGGLCFTAPNAAAPQAMLLRLEAYNDLNLNATAPTNQAQMEKDTQPIAATDGLDGLRAYSNAFNDVSLVTNNIQQMNVPEAQADLNALANEQGFGPVVTSINTARIEFTPSGAASYNITRTTAGGAAVNVNYAGAVPSTDLVNVAAIAGNGTPTVNVVTADPVSQVELVLNSINLALGDIITITPLDDLGYTGTPVSITLEDNVAATTALQPSYMQAGSPGVNSGVVANPFGNGGELANLYGHEAEIGMPILALTPGLLDNLDANGVNILNAHTPTVFGDETLFRELVVHNGKANPTDAQPVIRTAQVYDATAWSYFTNTAGALERRIGVAFTENIDLTGVTPTYGGSDIIGGSYAAKNNVAFNDKGGNLLPSVDLVAFETNNVLDLANNNNGKVLGFDGILDANGNPSSNAKVLLQDRMPAFVTKAEYTGDLIITFNEAISTPSNVNPVNIVLANRDLVLTGAATSDGALITLTTANQMTGPVTNWELSADGKTLTIYSSHVDMTATDLLANPIRTLFDWGSYAESAYDADAHEHTFLLFPDVRDRNGHVFPNNSGNIVRNSWAQWMTENGITAANIWPNFAVPAGVDMSWVAFAAADMVGNFTYDTDATSFVVGDPCDTQTQVIVWTFTHPIVADDGTGPATVDSIFDVDAGASVTANVDGSFSVTNARLQAVYNGALGDVSFNLGADAGTNVAFTGTPIDNGNTGMFLSPNHKKVTFEFRSSTVGCTVVNPTNYIQFQSYAPATSFQSAIDGSFITTVNGNAQ